MKRQSVSSRSYLLRSPAADRIAPYEPLRILVEAFAQDPAVDQVLYFGDSVIERVSRDDADATPLGQMVAERLAHRYQSCVVSYSALRPDGFLALSRVLTLTPARPRLLVLPINIRCFSPQWDWNPAFDFSREIASIDAYCRAPHRGIPRLIPTNRLPISLWKRWAFNRRRVQYSLGAFNRVGGFTKLIAKGPTDTPAAEFRWRQIFVFHYLYPLSAKHRQLHALRELLRNLKLLDIPVLCYITPLNYQAGARLLGEAFALGVSETVRKVLGLLSEEGGETATASEGARLVMADWSFRLPEGCFFHRNEPTEHLNEHGRHQLADAIAQLVLSRLAARPHRTMPVGPCPQSI